MFQSEELDNHLKTSNTVQTESVIFGEWNMNIPENIEKVGNYRYRPGTTDNVYSLLPVTYDFDDDGNYYTGATDSSISVQYGFDDEDIPVFLETERQKIKLIYSLDDCVKSFRPRSGINKILYLGQGSNQYFNIADESPTTQEVINITKRPRYYMASRYDQFKYWTSYRTEVVNGVEAEFGVSRPAIAGRNYIYDAVPFVVYNEDVPANRLVIKMQTNVGDFDNGQMRVGDEFIPDPFYGYENQTTPTRWAVEVLKGEDWVQVISFDENSIRSDGTRVIQSDGYVELAYGLQMPEQYQEFYTYAGELDNTSLLPVTAPYGYTYLIKQNQDDIGTLYFYDAPSWIPIQPVYGWILNEQEVDVNTPKVTKATNPDYYLDLGLPVYREFEFIRGIRIVVQTMNRENCTFDLIEMSPRLVVDLTEKVSSFNITKTMSDLGNGSIPVGSLSASNGNMEIFDDDFSFNANNVYDPISLTGSILAQYNNTRIQYKFYQVIRNVNNFDYFIPIKTMYSDDIPEVSDSTGMVSFEIRDLFFLLETSKAPEILISECSLSYAVSLVLDSIGFSNYVFKRSSSDSELVIPFFFVAPDQNVAEVLQQLAVASQSAMFFDEYNNLIVMSKNYLLPESEQDRETDSFLCGQEIATDQNGFQYTLLGSIYATSELPSTKEDGVYLNNTNGSLYLWNDDTDSWQNIGAPTSIAQPNIINLSSSEKKVYNEGRINYTTRYIQRAVSSYAQALGLEKNKQIGYKPSLLWEVAGRENIRSVNEATTKSDGFALTAAPLRTTLTADVPRVENNVLINNVIDIGDAVETGVSAFQGYFYANGEIIRYDAVEYAITGPLDDGLDGNVRWITSNLEYQNYFGKLKFNGKMYPTGNIRIFAEPDIESFNDGDVLKPKNGPVKTHGRGQFGTTITSHQAGIDPFWTDNANVYGCYQQTKDYLFNTSTVINYPKTVKSIKSGKANQAVKKDPSDNTGTRLVFDAETFSDDLAKNSTRTDVIKNHRASKYYTENERAYWSTDQVGTLQSSALVFNGPAVPEDRRTADFVSFITKEFDKPFKHFGTRMRIIGKIESTNQKAQTPYGSFPFYETQDLNVDDPSANIKVLGGSGGIAFNVNKTTSQGYYFEIASLTEDNVNQYNETNKETVVAYNILSSPAPRMTNNVVTVRTENFLDDLQVGQRVLVTGLVDSLDPNDTRTPLNGEYKVIAIGTDKKSFQYQIPGAALPNRTSTTSGTAKIAGTGQYALANLFFYKVVGDDKGNKVKSYSRTSNVLTLEMYDPNRFAVNDVITVPIDILQIAGTYIVRSVDGQKLIIDAPGANIAKVTPAFNAAAPNNVYLKNPLAIPVRLWTGLGNILADDGRFTGQYRFMGEENPTVYDLSAEYVNIGTTRRFYLYLNNRQVAVVNDLDPLNEYNSMALFVRGSSHCMFENVYALGANLSQNTSVPLSLPISKVWADDEIDSSEALRKYALSGMVQKTYLSSIGTEGSPDYDIFYDEFGTVLREAVYFNIRYDRAFPALYARLMKTFNRIKGYITSGFYGGSYGAEFLIFNATDTTLRLDDESGNYLRIQGIAFTQNTTNTLTVDEYFKKTTNTRNITSDQNGILINPNIQLIQYDKIKKSRDRYGSNEFTIESPYIQTVDAAENIFGWVINKISIPKKVIGLNTFATFNMQLGDIVTVNYRNNENLDIFGSESKRFIIYNMNYSKSSGEENMTMYLVEV